MIFKYYFMKGDRSMRGTSQDSRFLVIHITGVWHINLYALRARTASCSVCYFFSNSSLGLTVTTSNLFSSGIENNRTFKYS